MGGSKVLDHAGLLPADHHLVPDLHLRVVSLTGRSLSLLIRNTVQQKPLLITHHSYLVRLVPREEAASETIHCVARRTCWATHLLLVIIRRQNQFLTSLPLLYRRPGVSCRSLQATKFILRPVRRLLVLGEAGPLDWERDLAVAA